MLNNLRFLKVRAFAIAVELIIVITLLFPSISNASNNSQVTNLSLSALSTDKSSLYAQAVQIVLAQVATPGSPSQATPDSI